MIKRIAMLVMIFTLSLSAPALAAEDGVIEGWLVNGTAGGSSTANFGITLKTYLDDVETAATPAETDADGYFILDGLNTESGYSYQLELFFEGADYYSEWLVFTEGETTKSTEFVVYDSTTSDEAIRITESHSTMTAGGGFLEVVEWIWFENASDLTYIGSKEIGTEGDREILKFFLPDGASNLQLGGDLMECCFYDSEDGFIESMPVLPGVKVAAFSYEVDYSSGEYTLSRKVNYPMNSFNLFVKGEGIEVSGDRLTVEESIVVEDIWYNHVSSQELARGDVLVINLSNLPEADTQRVVLWVILALVVLTAGFIYLKRKGRLQPVIPADGLDQRRQRLLVELAQLDDDFEAGKIQEETYRRLRSAKKTQLVELV